jgi:cytochrome c
MSSFERNKIAGAFLGALLLAVGLNVISGELFAHHKPVRPGYELPAASDGPAVAAAPAAEPISERLAKANVSKGEADAKACQSCHSLDKAAASKLGPPLYGVVERKIASVEGFAYSGALQEKSGNWTFEELDRFLANPKSFANGTKMTYAGERDAAKRAGIILYLDSLSEHSVLPGQNAMSHAD